MKNRPHYRYGAELLFIIVLLCTTFHLSSAQTFINVVHDFETATLPSSFILKYNGTPQNIQVKEIDSWEMPTGITRGISPQVCGNRCIKFQGTLNQRMMGLVCNRMIDRTEIGNGERVIIQADFFLPADNTYFANVALLAVGHGAIAEKTPLRLYRFGILNGVTLYFSHMFDETQPVYYKHQPMGDLNIISPGWHRFRMIFEGAQKIVCTVDGKNVDFCPFNDIALTHIYPGIMVVSSPTTPQHCYVDNLGIQYIKHESSLPPIPWVTGKPLVKSGKETRPDSRPVTHDTPAAGESQQPLQWLSSFEEGIRKGAHTGRKVIVMFYSPNLKICDEMETLIKQNADVKSLLGQFVLVKLNIRDAAGRSLAQQFGAFKVPCFVVVSPEGTRLNKTYYQEYGGWEPVGTKLREALSR